MNEKTIKAILIVIIFTGGIVIIVQLLINKLSLGTMLNKLIPFIQRYEGGLSRDPKDSASSHPAPWPHNGQTGWHTNKGVTYMAFVAKAKRGGYAVTAKNFFEMPDHIWMSILKNGYMSAFPLEEINHLPRIQAVIISWAWGSGVKGAERRLANFQREEMGIVDSNITPDEIVKNFKKKVNTLNEKKWFLALCDRREADFRKMPTFYAHGNGWLNRLNAFRNLFA